MHSDWLLLGMTAIIGFLCGAWLYTTVFVPEYVENPYLNELRDERTVPFTVNAEEYGECERYTDCRAFSVEDDRSYRYRDFDGEFHDGEISAALRAKVITALEAADLLGRDMRCVDRDRNHIRYSIYFNDNYYIIDACSGGAGTEPIRTFGEVWQFLIDLHSEPLDNEAESTSTPILQSPTDVLFSEDMVQ